MTIKYILHVLYSMHSLEPDVQSEDGIYSAYVHSGCQGDNGRHNSKVIITGNADTALKRIKICLDYAFYDKIKHEKIAKFESFFFLN